MEAKKDAMIAGGVVLASLGLGVVLLMSIGKISMPGESKAIMMDFERVDNVKPNLTQVKLAGIPVGKVTAVRILDNSERAKLLAEGRPLKNIRVTANVLPGTLLCSRTTASIRQASLMSEHFIELSAGAPDDPPMPVGFVIDGSSPAAMGDLMTPGNEMLVHLKDAAAKLKEMMVSMNSRLPGIMSKLDGVLGNTETLTGDLATPENRAKIKEMIANMKVTSENLKVVSTHVKLMTATLGQRPWRLLFGGEPNKLPDEKKIIESTKAYPVQPSEKAK